MINSPDKVAVLCKFFVIFSGMKCPILNGEFWATMDHEDDVVMFMQQPYLWPSSQEAIEAIKSKSHLTIIDEIHVGDTVILVNDFENAYPAPGNGITHLVLKANPVVSELY